MFSYEIGKWLLVYRYVGTHEQIQIIHSHARSAFVSECDSECWNGPPVWRFRIRAVGRSFGGAEANRHSNSAHPSTTDDDSQSSSDMATSPQGNLIVDHDIVRNSDVSFAGFSLLSLTPGLFYNHWNLLISRCAGEGNETRFLRLIVRTSVSDSKCRRSILDI